MVFHTQYTLAGMHVPHYAFNTVSVVYSAMMKIAWATIPAEIVSEQDPDRRLRLAQIHEENNSEVRQYPI